MNHIRQDMPPEGGFKPIIYERVLLKKFWPAHTKWAIMIGVTAFGYYLYSLDKKRNFYHSIEKQSARLALYPLLLAESDRFRLRQYRRNRDLESELMKDVDGWKVGTYSGEPIYKTLEPNEWYEPVSAEYFVHGDQKKYIRSTCLHHYF